MAESPKGKLKKVPPRKKRDDVVDRRLEIVYVPTSELRLWDKNPRKNSDAVDKLSSLMDRWGFTQPVIATRDKVIRAGNTRLKSAIQRGEREVPVIYMDFDSEEEAELFSIADNKSHEFSTWDEEKLRKFFADSLETLSAQPIALSEATGFTQLEIEGIAGGGSQTSTPGTKTFKEAVREFQQSNVNPMAEAEQWVWIEVTGTKKQFRRLLRKYGVPLTDPKKRRSQERQLDWDKVSSKLLEVR